VLQSANRRCNGTLHCDEETVQRFLPLSVLLVKTLAIMLPISPANPTSNCAIPMNMARLW